jgi:hypothetical protein
MDLKSKGWKVKLLKVFGNNKTKERKQNNQYRLRLHMSVCSFYKKYIIYVNFYKLNKYTVTRCKLKIDYTGKQYVLQWI